MGLKRNLSNGSPAATSYEYSTDAVNTDGEKVFGTTCMKAFEQPRRSILAPERLALYVYAPTVNYTIHMFPIRGV